MGSGCRLPASISNFIGVEFYIVKGWGSSGSNIKLYGAETPAAVSCAR